MAGKRLIGSDRSQTGYFSLIISQQAILIWGVVWTVVGAVPVISIQGGKRIIAESPSIIGIK